MTSRLAIYNDALLICGERALSSLTEDREPRRLLDQVWQNEGVEYCLEEAQWYFAMRTVRVDYDPDVDPGFGVRRGFSKPSDWILTSALCADEYFRAPVTRYFDEAGFWYSDLDTLYVRYVSNDTEYGMDLARWPRTFTEFVAAHFATKVVLKLSNDEDRLKKAVGLREGCLKKAKNKCAMAMPTIFEAQGNWSKARQRWQPRRDGGSNGGNLIG